MNIDSGNNDGAGVLRVREEAGEAYGKERREADRRIASLEQKLEDTIELLHMWKNEANDYRLLLESIVEGNTSIEKAREVCEANFRKGGKRERGD